MVATEKKSSNQDTLLSYSFTSLSKSATPFSAEAKWLIFNCKLPEPILRPKDSNVIPK